MTNRRPARNGAAKFETVIKFADGTVRRVDGWVHASTVTGLDANAVVSDEMDWSEPQLFQLMALALTMSETARRGLLALGYIKEWKNVD